MASSGSQKIWVSSGKINETAETYIRIRKLIDEELGKSVPIDTLTRRISGVSASTFRNYITKNSPQYGRVSQFTAMNLANYSGIPYEVFTGHQVFADQYQDAFRECLKRDFKSSPQVQPTTATNFATASDQPKITNIISAPANLVSLHEVKGEEVEIPVLCLALTEKGGIFPMIIDEYSFISKAVVASSFKYFKWI